MKTYLLNNNIEIPVIGFGTYKLDKSEITNSVRTAYESGYRLFDTASVYTNEKEVGEALKIYDRDSYFLTSKLWIEDILKNSIHEALENSLSQLQTNYLDLYLVHWPINATMDSDYQNRNLKVWKEMIKILESGKVRSIGVSNFTPRYLQQLLNTSVVPAVNQIEYHPGYLQKETVDYSKAHGIQVEAWSPLARNRIADNNLLEDLADKYHKSISQIIIRFIIQNQIIPIPKATSVEHIKENIDVFDFKLTEKEMAALSALPQEGYSGLDPDNFQPSY